MTAPLEYGWRTGAVQIMRSGFHGIVERYWCDGSDKGWRWRCFNSSAIQGSATSGTSLMPYEEAKQHVEEWIAAQIERAGLEGTAP